MCIGAPKYLHLMELALESNGQFELNSIQYLPLKWIISCQMLNYQTVVPTFCLMGACSMRLLPACLWNLFSSWTSSWSIIHSYFCLNFCQSIISFDFFCSIQIVCQNSKSTGLHSWCRRGKIKMELCRTNSSPKCAVSAAIQAKGQVNWNVTWWFILVTRLLLASSVITPAHAWAISSNTC